MTWSQFSLPAIEIGRLFVMLPVLPFAVATTFPSMVSLRPVDVRAQWAMCHCPSLRTPGETTCFRRNLPDELVPRKTHVRRPPGFSILKYPPDEPAWPFWTMFPKCLSSGTGA